MKNEFENTPFYPTRFNWRNCNLEEIKEACRILNDLTPQQIHAVEIFGENRYRDGFEANDPDL